MSHHSGSITPGATLPAGDGGSGIASYFATDGMGDVLASPTVPEADPAPYCTCRTPDPVPLKLGAATIGHLCRKCARRIRKP